MKLLVLGGTREANTLASTLIREGHDPTTSLAGRTKEPIPPKGRFRVGGFGGAEGLAAFLTETQFDALIDATHPFATTISQNASIAARSTGTPFVCLWRKPWKRHNDDDWRAVASVPEAATLLPAGSKTLVALGRQHVNPFFARTDCRLVLRSIEPIEAGSGLEHVETVLARPSSRAGHEANFMRDNGITHIVSRNSGGAGAYAKIEAARMLRLPIFMIDRPEPPEPHVNSIGEVIQWARTLPPRF